MKVLIICDHYPLSPRVKKVRNSLMKLHSHCEVKVFAWNRESKEVKENFVITFDQNIGYGYSLNKLTNILKFIKEMKKYINKFQPDYLHAIDFEMLLASNFISKKTALVYEVYDLKIYHNKLFNVIRERIEKEIINKNVAGMILASPFFKKYYDDLGVRHNKVITLNNKPLKTIETNISHDYLKIKNEKDNTKITIGFIGTIRYKDILYNLINAASAIDNIKILLAGGGPDYKEIKNYIKKHNLEEKAIMTGRFEEEDLPIIYNACQYIWAAYPNKDLNVKYAISNKFFESMAFNKEIIVSENTMVGEAVYKHNVGYTVDPYSEQSIFNLLASLSLTPTPNKAIEFGEGYYWEDEEENIKKIY